MHVLLLKLDTPNSSYKLLKLAFKQSLSPPPQLLTVECLMTPTMEQLLQPIPPSRTLLPTPVTLATTWSQLCRLIQGLVKKMECGAPQLPPVSVG